VKGKAVERKGEPEARRGGANFGNEKPNKEGKKQKQEKKCANSAESLRLDHETHWNTVVRDTFWDDDEELWDTMSDGSSLTVMTNRVLWRKGLALETRTTRTTQCYEDYDRLYTDYVSESRVYFEENFRLRFGGASGNFYTCGGTIPGH